MRQSIQGFVKKCGNAWAQMRALRERINITTAGRAVSMGIRRHWVIGLALLSAVGAFWMTQQYVDGRLSKERERLLPRGGLIEVLVAARDLNVGDVASPVTVAVRRMPQDWSLPNSITPLDFDAVNQRPIAKPIKAGHPLTADHLRQDHGVEGGLRLEPGFRAVSIAVDEVSSVGGLIQPGDRIDLWASALPRTEQSEGAIVSLTAERSPPQPQARLIAEDLRVIATGGKTERIQEAASAASSGAGLYATLTLAVPETVANLVLGGQLQGRLGIALRSPQERQRLASHRAAPKRQGPPTAGPIEILIGSGEGAMR